jgi:hypothetical protein
VKTTDDRDFITSVFKRLHLAEETQLLFSVGADVSKMSQALVNGDVAGYHQAALTAENDFAAADQTFTKNVGLLRKFA